MNVYFVSTSEEFFWNKAVSMSLTNFVYVVSPNKINVLLCYK